MSKASGKLASSWREFWIYAAAITGTIASTLIIADYFFHHVTIIIH
jgi:hypothetical protein